MVRAEGAGEEQQGKSREEMGGGDRSWCVESVTRTPAFTLSWEGAWGGSEQRRDVCSEYNRTTQEAGLRRQNSLVA